MASAFVREMDKRPLGRHVLERLTEDVVYLRFDGDLSAAEGKTVSVAMDEWTWGRSTKVIVELAKLGTIGPCEPKS